MDDLRSVFPDLMKREPARLVAATGILFETIAKSYKTKSVEEVLESHRAGVWGPASEVGTGYPILRSTNMRGHRADVRDVAWRKVPESKAKVFALQPGDILVTKSSGSSDLVGKAVLFDLPPDGNTYLFSNFTHRLRPNQEEIDPQYLAWFLRSPQALRWRYGSQQTTVGLRNLRMSAYLAQRVPVPGVPLQAVFVDYLDKLELGTLGELPASFAQQQHAIETVATLEMLRKLQTQNELRINALIPAVLDRALDDLEVARDGPSLHESVTSIRP